ncbi:MULTISPECIES: multicopper oxidase domain-containing protein [Vagococcus]|uniref:Multicopper oxidase n=1 Tax=Vagococcus fluvialis bH819 TaxID=1255619 RepID=A0A1X6WLD7_9ENTE|nr:MULTISPECIES: multicopper oxidase domain-containing protein [Vagococcus]SLM85134.1 Multicopper oxidase [Vagococcus fluvialis bH819]HCM88451.1 copper oxidase [Vagococcus sp.]
MKNKKQLIFISSLTAILLLGLWGYRNWDLSGMKQMHSEDKPHLEVRTETTKKALPVPPLLEPTSETKERVEYELKTQQGDTSILKGAKTKTLGYNGDLLGPIIKVRQGQEVVINTENTLDEETSFHWHGLKTSAESDGGPHQLVPPRSKEKISFKVDQEAATLWFHPHPEGKTASQVYRGLAGLLYVEDDHSDELNLPKEYGVDDFPLITQDRYFDKNNQIDYNQSARDDGTKGDTLLINGSLSPYVEITTTWVRYRLVNGSNATNFTYNLENNQSFYQIATDGGFLNQSQELKSLTLSPGERAEILINTDQSQNKEKLNLLVNGTVALQMNLTNKKTDQNILINQPLNQVNEIEENTLTSLKKQTIDLKGMSHMVSINGETFDRDKINLKAPFNTKEVWEVNNISNMMGGMIHPFHIHGVQFQIISRNGQKPNENEKGWKDTVLVNPDEQIKLLISFDKKGVFMYHCHILEHEENGMMGQLEVS